MSRAALKVDPVILEIVEGTVESTRVEIELQIERTARSTVIRDQKDYRAGVYDSRGRSISSVSSAANVDPILKRFGIGKVYEGDIFLWNHPYQSEGGIGQTPDICITAPVFHGEELVCFVQVFGHVHDIGGRVPGSLPIDATSVYDEGLLIPPVKLYERNILNEFLYSTILANSKFPVELRGDVDAEINACRLGVRRMKELFKRYGKDTVDACFEHLLDRCAEDIRKVVFPLLSNGESSFEDFVEVLGMVPGERRKLAKLKVTVRKTPDKLIFDLTGTDEQLRIPINLPGNEKYYEKYFSSVFRALYPSIIVNEGTRKVVQVILPKRTVLSPESPIPTGNRHWTMFRLWDLCFGGLAELMKGRVPAQQDTRHIIHFVGKNADGTPFFLRDMLGGGGPARYFADGSDAVSANVRSRNIPSEFLERFYPLRIEKLGLAIDSGGPGKFRGGLGYHKEYTLLADGEVMIHSDRMFLSPCGVNGGLAATSFKCIINPGKKDEIIVPSKIDHLPVKRGDLIYVDTTGGGGWGDPLTREIENVRLDVVRGLVSLQKAHDVYGIVFSDPSKPELDKMATTELRAKLIDQPSRRMKMIDRGPNFDKIAHSVS